MQDFNPSKPDEVRMTNHQRYLRWKLKEIVHRNINKTINKAQWLFRRKKDRW